MAHLAIQGHATRGNEVIELLKMLGGIDSGFFSGNEIDRFYYIEVDKGICFIDSVVEHLDFHKMTLEQFLKRFPYKVGDKVTLDKFPCTIKGMSWDCDDVIYYVQGVDFSKGVYSKDKDLQPYKEETLEERQYKELRMPLDDDDKLATEVTIDDNKILPPNGYLIGKITQVDNGMLVEYVKQQPSYPKTYEECCEVLGIGSYFEPEIRNATTEECHIFMKLMRLKRYRDAYWKIAGKEMGLGKPWEPDWKKHDKKYIISVFEDAVIYFENETYNRNAILAFPTAEMRDTFHENFKDLIEQCKELL